MLRVVRLGTPRAKDEGTRIGTVRRPPRGVTKAKFASDDWYDVWVPELAPSASLVKRGLAARTPAEWTRFVRAYRREMADQHHTLELLAALSRTANFSVGCYCEDEARCHRSVLRGLLAERGAAIDTAPPFGGAASPGRAGLALDTAPPFGGAASPGRAGLAIG